VTAKLPRAAAAALWTSESLVCKRYIIGSKVSRLTSLTSINLNY